MPDETESFDARVAPALAIMKDLLVRSDERKVAEAQASVAEEAARYAAQNASVVEIPGEKQIYVSIDGDNIGNRVMEAEEKNDEKALSAVSARIESGQKVFADWAKALGGVVIEAGGDEGLVRVPAAAMSEIQSLRSSYQMASGATSTIGVGETIRQASQARMVGKLRGKDRTVVFEPSIPKELKLLLEQRGPETQTSKIKDAGLGGPPESRESESPKWAAPESFQEEDQKKFEDYEAWKQKNFSEGPKS